MKAGRVMLLIGVGIIAAMALTVRKQQRIAQSSSERVKGHEIEA